jgi:hypothetical protein
MDAFVTLNWSRDAVSGVVLGIAFFSRRTKAPTSLTRLWRDLGLMTDPLYLVYNVVGRAFRKCIFFSQLQMGLARG